MGVAAIGSRTSGSFGTTKSNAVPVRNEAVELDALQYNRVADAVIEIQEEIGTTVSPDPGTIEARLVALEGVSAGDFSGPASSTDNAFVRFDGAGGKTGQNGQTTEDDSGNVSVAGNITVGGTVDGRDLAVDGSKLDGVASGATANSSDATLLDRANHTGTQAISTVTGLQTALDAKAVILEEIVHTTSTLTLAPGTHAWKAIRCTYAGKVTVTIDGNDAWWTSGKPTIVQFVTDHASSQVEFAYVNSAALTVNPDKTASPVASKVGAAYVTTLYFRSASPATGIAMGDLL